MPKKILLIDDEPDTVSAMMAVLRKNGYEVIASVSGTDGLEKADKHKPDLAIVDLMLPDIDGWRVCQKLKMSHTCGHIPIIVLSAWLQNVKEQVAPYEVGDAFIDKQSDLSVIVAKVKELLNEPPKEEK